MVINDWKACYFFFIAVVFYRLLFSIQLKLCVRARLSGVCFSHLIVSNRRPTLEHNFSDHSVCLHSYCSHFIDRDICLAEWIFNTLWLYWKQQQQKHSILFLSLTDQFHFFFSFLSTFITLACVLFRWAVSVSHHYLEMCFQMKQYNSSRFSIHLVNQWSEFTGYLCQQSPSGKLWIQTFSIKTANHHFWKMCIQDVLTIKTRDDASERDGTWRWRVNHTKKYSWKIKFSLTTSIFSDCLICNITSVLRLALLAFAGFFSSIFWSVLFGWAVRKSG